MTRDEKIKYVRELFSPLWTDRMIVAYSQYFKWKGRITTIESNEEDFRIRWKKNGHTDAEIEQGLWYMKDIARED